jgi:outer membrane lipoprotein-sorting protein
MVRNCILWERVLRMGMVWNKKLHTGLITAIVLIASATARAQSADVQKVLAQMDAASARFQSTQANFVWDQYTKVVDSHDQQSGTIVFVRTGGTTQMSAHIAQPGVKDLVYKGGELHFYQPDIKQLTVFTAGANRSQYESFLTLGFGGSGKELASNWDINYLGSEAIGGVQTAKLELKSKQESVRNTFDHVTIWIDPSRAISLKQEFVSPSGDMKTCDYTNIKYNAPVPSSVFTIKTAPGTQTIKK